MRTRKALTGLVLPAVLVLSGCNAISDCARDVASGIARLAVRTALNQSAAGTAADPTPEDPVHAANQTTKAAAPAAVCDATESSRHSEMRSTEDRAAARGTAVPEATAPSTPLRTAAAEVAPTRGERSTPSLSTEPIIKWVGTYPGPGTARIVPRTFTWTIDAEQIHVLKIHLPAPVPSTSPVETALPCPHSTG